MRKSEFKKMFELEDKHFWFVGKRYFIKTIIDSFLPKSDLKILDIGCGTGGTTVLLKKYGKVIGLEKNKYAQKLAKKKDWKLSLATLKNYRFLIKILIW
jgi:ubiquinone/menaquinone biosynthesis C-methylase UbiE